VSADPVALSFTSVDRSKTSRPRPIRRPAFSSRPSVESYLRAAFIPRYMERLREIHDEYAVHRLQLEQTYRRLAEDCRDDAALFERRWRSMAEHWNFDRVNELISQHNEYYPIEAQLAVDPRTGEYVTLRGRPYRRDPLDAAWVLERFPPRVNPADAP
jgi:hypothetical protein